MPNAIKKSFQKLVILLLICELVRVFCVERPHQLTELLLVDAFAVVTSVAFEVVDQRLVKTLFCRSIIWIINWSGEHVLHEMSYAIFWMCAHDRNVIVSAEVKQ